LALKKGLKLALASTLFTGLFKGAAGIFFATLLANRGALLFGSYLLSLSAKSLDIYEAVIGAIFVTLGYTVFRPFNFNFLSQDNIRQRRETPTQREDTTTIDAEIVENFEKIEKK